MSLTHALVLEELIRKGELHQTIANKKIGYYIGSFDPLHLGHEATVQEILNKSLCDYVLIYPAWGHDIYKNRTDVSIRLEMLFAAFAKHPKVIITKLHPQALQNTLMQEDNQLIAGKSSVKSKIAGVQYIGIIGSDTAFEAKQDSKKLSVFMKGIEVSEKYAHHTIGGIIAIPVQSFIVSLRAGDSLEAFNGKLGDRPIIHTVNTKYPHVSSTKIRTIVKNHGSIDNLVSAGVNEVIAKHTLYQQ